MSWWATCWRSDCTSSVMKKAPAVRAAGAFAYQDALQQDQILEAGPPAVSFSSMLSIYTMFNLCLISVSL
ncbi:hypothetical protein [Aeromonas taiwanensis]|uniref:hypothetical protein n=1 Tax=Aeromonas taiwanensis TaxID=633417 RepID=UPI003BA28515